jgi:acyl-CoA thioesterase
MSAEYEADDFYATALTVEKLDTYLYRAAHMETPRGSRGVFGGQIISLSLAAATECVDRKYSLHVCSNIETRVDR